MRTELELWLDESGNFEEDADERWNPSLVGGVLVKKGDITEQSAKKFIGRKTIHYTELNDGTENMRLLEWVNQQNGEFVIFGNEERVKIIDGDTTYLYVLSEGIVRLLSYLSALYQDFTLRVLIATRREMAKETGIIAQEKYAKLLRERVIAGLARESLTNANSWNYHIEFGDARDSYRLMLADGVCNTYLTRTGIKKFTDEQRARIQELYNEQYIFSFFEHTGKAKLKRLLAEGNLGEVIFESYLEVNKDIKEELLTLALEKLSKLEQSGQQHQLDGVAYKIGSFIKLDRNYTYIRPVLIAMQDDLLPRLAKKNIDMPTFDLDVILYLYTLYTHEGSRKATEQDKLFLNKLSDVKDIMKKFEYFNMYQLRRAIHEKNMFNIKEAVEDTGHVIHVLEEMVELMEVLNEDIGMETGSQQYEAIGKAYGTRGQGYTMLIHKDQGSFSKAVADFTNALKHFNLDSDKERQYLYLSQAHAEVGKLEEAIQWLYEAMFIERKDDQFQELLQLLKEKDIAKNIFIYYTYFKIMESAVRHNELPIADAMYDALARENIHVSQLSRHFDSVHPMQFILWDYASYLFAKGRSKQAHEFLDEAIERCENKGLTIRVIQLGMYAKKVLMDDIAGNKERAERTRQLLRTSLQTINEDKQDTTAIMEYINNITAEDLYNEEKLRKLIRSSRAIN